MATRLALAALVGYLAGAGGAELGLRLHQRYGQPRQATETTVEHYR